MPSTPPIPPAPPFSTAPAVLTAPAGPTSRSGLVLTALLIAVIAVLGALAAAGTARGAPARPPVRIRQEPIPVAPQGAGACAPDQGVAGGAAAIANLTSSLRFLPPALACLPSAPGVPGVQSPLQVLGHVAGAAELARTADLGRYLRQLALASDRVRVRPAGISEEGREILLVTVSEAHNLAELDYFRDSAVRLADPRHTARPEAERLADLGRAIVYVVGGTRPGDVASPEMLTELAYRLAVSERPEIRAVRENAIVLITPAAEPDAYDRQVEWYRRHLQARAELPWTELREILAPPYAGHYGGALWAAAGDTAGALASTRAEAAVFFGLRPQVVVELGGGPPLLALAGAAGAAGGELSPVGAAGPGSPAAGAAGVEGAETPAAGATGLEPPAASADLAARVTGPRSPAAGGADLADGADAWPPLAAAVAAQLRSWGMPGVQEAGAGVTVPGLDPMAAEGSAGVAVSGRNLAVPGGGAGLTIPGPNLAVSGGGAGLTVSGPNLATPGSGAGVSGMDGGAVPLAAGPVLSATGSVLALALDHLAVGGLVGVFSNGTAGTFQRQVGELEPAASGAAGAGPATTGMAAGSPASGGRSGAGTAPARQPPGAAAHGRQRTPGMAVHLDGAGWPAEGRTSWSLRDSVNYGEGATLAALSWVAAHRRELLLGAWQRGRRAWETAGDRAPYAWIFSTRQPDPGRLAALVQRLLGQRIEVDRLSAPLDAGGRHFPAGSYVVRLDQPYRQAAMRYLAGGEGPARMAAGAAPPVAWTFLYNVEGVLCDDRAVLDAPMTEIAAPEPLAGGIDDGEPAARPGVEPPPGQGAGPGAAVMGEGAAAGQQTAAGGARGAPADDEVFLLRDTGQTALVAAWAALGAYQVDVAEAAFTSGGMAYPPGSWIVQAPRAQVAAVAASFGLRFQASAGLPEVARHVAHLPRLALLHGWTDTEPSAWMRHALDRDHLPYTLISGDDLRAGELRDRFDLILLGGVGDGAEWRRELQGTGARWSPLAYTRTPDFPSHGVPDGTPDATVGLGGAAGAGGGTAGSGSGDAPPGTAGAVAGTADATSGLGGGGARIAAGTAAPEGPAVGSVGGGRGEPGIVALRQFVESGGVLVTLGGSSALAAGTGLAPGLSVEAAPEPAPPAAGPEPEAAELRAQFALAGHPLAYGYPVVTQVLRRGGPLFALAPASRGRAVLRFATGEPGGSGAAAGVPPGFPGAGTAATSAGPRQGTPAVEEEDIGGPAARSGHPAGAEGRGEGGMEAGATIALDEDERAARPPNHPGAASPRPRPLGAADGRLVLGGSAAGAEAVAGRPAIVDLVLGRGHVVAFAFDPFDPSAGPADLRLIHNLLLNWHALPGR